MASWHFEKSVLFLTSMKCFTLTWMFVESWMSFPKLVMLCSLQMIYMSCFFFFSREYVLLHENSSEWCSLSGFSSMIFWHQHSGESRTFCLSIKSLFWYVGDLVVVLILLHLGIGEVLCLMWELNWFKLMGLTLSLCSHLPRLEVLLW